MSERFGGPGAVAPHKPTTSLLVLFRLLCAMLAFSVLIGVITAGIYLPAVGLTGSSARSGVDFFNALPAELEQQPLAQRSKFLAADGSTIGVFYKENRIIVPLSNIAPIMRKAQIAIEDARFYDHGGIDPKGVMRAALSNASSGSSSQGASTLTQQYVKLTLQENAVYAGDEEGVDAASEKSVARKIQEIKYSIGLEKKLSKDKILEGYLNIAYFSDGAYGIEAAARHFFSTTAAKLTLPQAALLAGVVQQPTPYNPTKYPKASVDRRNQVLSRMLATGVITKKDHDVAVKTKLKLVLSETENGCTGSKYPFFCDFIYRQLLADKRFGATEQERRELVFRGGITVQTTLNPKLQKAAETAILKRVAPVNSSKVASAMSVVEPGTGKVLAMAQSRPFGQDSAKGQTTINYNVDKALGGGNGFETASTFKPFTLAAALKDGRSTNDVVVAPPDNSPFDASNTQLGGDCEDARVKFGRPYTPSNSEGNESGTNTLRHYTIKSVNTAYVKLAADIGLCKVQDMASRFGLHLAQATTKDQPGGKLSTALRPYQSLTLGPEGIAPLTVAAAYAGLAAEGKFCPPISITSVKTYTGKDFKVPPSSCRQATDKSVARGVNDVLQDVFSPDGTGRKLKIGRPAGGKTGTSNNSYNVWFAGYIPQMASAVWLGHPAGNTSLRQVNTGRDYYEGPMYGSTLCGPTWQDFMKDVIVDLPVRNFTPADSRTLNGAQVGVPSVLGRPLDQAKAILTGAGFGVTVGAAEASVYAQGTVARQSPGLSAPPGSVITIYPSAGGGQPGGFGGGLAQPKPNRNDGGALGDIRRER
jgi:membrane peptidoglycan carboxypeptidase